MHNTQTLQKPVQTLAGTLHQWILLSSCFSFLLLTGRIMVTGELNYLFLPWNLFLAYIPYWITRQMYNHPDSFKNNVKKYLALASWLLFVPNSFYIITDLFHLTHIDSAPKWFDLLLIFSFAWNGILFGIISLYRVEQLISFKYRKGFAEIFIFMIMWLNAFGVYIGRYLRFNSWDIITNPVSLFGEIINMIIHPLQNGSAWGMTLCYTIFMTLLYLMIKKMSEIFRQ
ncbi:MAG TPA: DUF1361 domain-containing protein [Chitinophagaceae bacterium]|nr:DUF1361 domain-containing protein [Chitinophagaceae bacterium]MCB9055514.1 DUF1361 domain-containing protein [Chitinophagales bacterium]HPG11611.1 DUF1361 domain-containing protein [Chitinophagaceae bacterium]HRX93576.1 DUF1361 domain-containing protein [Chitinophagaceae bacterium]